MLAIFGASGCRTETSADVKDLAVSEGGFTRLLYVSGDKVCSARCDQAQFDGVKAQIIGGTLSHADATAKLHDSCIPEASIDKAAMPGSAAFKAAVTDGKLFTASKANVSYVSLLAAMKGAACPGPDESDIVLVGADDAVTPVDGGFTPPAGAVASPLKLEDCPSGPTACAQFINDTDLGCFAKSPEGKIFKSLNGGNNSCDFIALQAQVCAATGGKAPAGFTGSCFVKGNADRAGGGSTGGGDAAVFTPPADSVSTTSKLFGSCDQTMACPQFIDAVSLGCVAKLPDGTLLQSMTPGNNSCAAVGLVSKVCAAGATPGQVFATCFAKKAANPPDPLAALPGTTAAPATIAACGGGAMACPQFIDNVSLGCAAVTADGNVFRDATAGNNSCSAIALRAMICGAGAKPEGVRAACFTKDPLAAPPNATASPVTLSACGGVMACPQFIDGVSLGCAAVAADGRTFQALKAGNNSCASIALRKQVCDAGLAAADVKAVSFRKRGN